MVLVILMIIKKNIRSVMLGRVGVYLIKNFVIIIWDIWWGYDFLKIGVLFLIVYVINIIII